MTAPESIKGGWNKQKILLLKLVVQTPPGEQYSDTVKVKDDLYGVGKCLKVVILRFVTPSPLGYRNDRSRRAVGQRTQTASWSFPSASKGFGGRMVIHGRRGSGRRVAMGMLARGVSVLVLYLRYLVS